MTEKNTLTMKDLEGKEVFLRPTGNNRRSRNVNMTKLPYDFDLLFDIKSVEELHRILLEESLDILHDQGELEDLMKSLIERLPQK